MRTLAIGIGIAALLFLVSGGRLIFIPLLFVPLGLFSLRRGRDMLSSLQSRRPLTVRRRAS